MTDKNTIQALVRHSFEGEMKLLINDYGDVIKVSEKSQNLEISRQSNIVELFTQCMNDFSGGLLKSIVKNQIHFESELHSKNTRKWFRVLMSPVDVDGDSLILVQCIDNTKFKRLEELTKLQEKRVESEIMLRTQGILQTERAMQDQGGFLTNFLRGLRHDLISPITQLKEIVDYFIKAEEGHKKERAAGLIKDSLNKLSKTSEGFSEFVDLHYKLESDFQIISFQECFSDIKIILDNESPSLEITYAVDFSDKPELFFSAKLLKSIFYNLLSNAIKFRSEDRDLKIELKSFVQNGKVVLEVKDNGIGINLEKNKHLIFAPFKRINNSRPGVGVGLSLVKSILEKDNKGSIAIKSTENVGTTFTVNFNKLG